MRSTTFVGARFVIIGWVAVVLSALPAHSQTQNSRDLQSDGTIDAATRAQVAESFAKVLADEYAYADKGAQMADAIRSKLKFGRYDQFADGKAFAAALEADARAISNDKHLRVNFGSSGGPRMIMRRGKPSADAIAQMRRQNASIPGVTILQGNIGYLPVDGMLPAQAADDAIAAAFAFLHNTDALIIDLRNNPGGSGYAEVYLSYLSEGAPYLTGTAHWRKDNRVQEFKTADMGAASYGAKKPVFVLTSHRTFSAAEGLAYEIQAFKRGTIVGETTGGGANPSAGGATTDLGHGFSVNVPTGYVVSAATGTNWEGVGVKPDVEVPPTEALGKAWSLAAQRLTPDASDPDRRDVLEALAGAKLTSEPSITPAELTGEYRLSGGKIVMIGGVISNLVIKSTPEGLVTQTTDAEIHLLRAGGDRYCLSDYPIGFDLIFYKKDGKIFLLRSIGTSTFRLEKR